MSAPKPPPPSRTHLLSAEDMFCIAHQGAPTGLRAELVQLGMGGRVVFTIRGIQFYKHALQQHGVAADLSAVRTEADVLRMHVDLGTAAFSRQVAEMPANLADAQAQSAVVGGALEVITQAATRLRAHAMPASETA